MIKSLRSNTEKDKRTEAVKRKGIDEIIRQNA